MSTKDRARYEMIMANPVKKAELYARNETYRLSHSEQRRESQRKYRMRNLEKLREQGRVCAQDTRRRLRLEVLQAYGNACVWCREGRPECLELDHINNDGNKHRETLSSPAQLHSWLKNNNYPEDVVQILCGSCHNMKSYYGVEGGPFDENSCIDGGC